MKKAATIILTSLLLFGIVVNNDGRYKCIIPDRTVIMKRIDNE